jgi:Domain of unknown function (DUF4232)
MPNPTVDRPWLRLTLAASALLLATVAGCSGHKATAKATGAGTGTGPSTGTGTGAAASQPAACTVPDLTADLILQPARSNGTTRMALLQLTNASSRPCRLTGWATVTLLDASGQPAKVPTTDVDQPGAAAPVDLTPGTSASAGVKWTVCAKSSADCPTGNAIQIGLPKSGKGSAAKLSGFPPAEASSITMKSVQIGTIQANPQGVVAW